MKFASPASWTYWQGLVLVQFRFRLLWTYKIMNRFHSKGPFGRAHVQRMNGPTKPRKKCQCLQIELVNGDNLGGLFSIHPKDTAEIKADRTNEVAAFLPHEVSGEFHLKLRERQAQMLIPSTSFSAFVKSLSIWRWF